MDRFVSETVVDLKETLKQLSSQEVYGMVLGDIVWDVMPLYDSYKKVISDLDLTMYHVIGRGDLINNISTGLCSNKEEYGEYVLVAFEPRQIILMCRESAYYFQIEGHRQR